MVCSGTEATIPGQGYSPAGNRGQCLSCCRGSGENADDSRLMTLVGPVGKPEIVSIPMVFLHALLENDLGRFAMVARDAGYTTWEVPGAKPVRLPNDFVNELSIMLKYQSVVSWLCQFGAQGRCVAPLVAGSLIGLAFQDSSQPVPANKEMVTTENLVSALESMAYQPAEAREMVSRVASRLRADMTLEEAIRLTLQMGKEGITMDNEFTADEIRDAVRMARVHCPGFSEDDFESLMELERRITDSGYLEAVLGLIRLEEEKGISCTEALDACEKLIKQKTKLEQEISALKQRSNDLLAQIKKARLNTSKQRKLRQRSDRN